MDTRVSPFHISEYAPGISFQKYKSLENNFFAKIYNNEDTSLDLFDEFISYSKTRTSQYVMQYVII